jgi:hypothetical protein
MTPKQKFAVGVLATVNIAAITTLVVLFTRPVAFPTSSYSSIPTPSRFAMLALPPSDCQWRATQLLARAGLAGTVTMTGDGSLDFDITYPLAPGQVIDEAAEAVWTAFEVALAVREYKCVTFIRIGVTVLVHSEQADTQIDARVSVADLLAYGAGELSAERFIERVTYAKREMHESRWDP